jgi:DNA polymerase elongation subunit (family B)
MSYFLSASINDVLYSSASMMVEKLFIKDYNKNNKIIPNKPNRNQIQSRYKHKFKGSFVYQPKAGLYKDVAIVDFRSYHISLLISYNISPETIDNNYNNYNNYNKDNEQYTILDHKISKKPKGFVPSLLENLLDLRMHFKDLMKKEKKHSSKYNSLYSKQYAIKILLASTYGYLGYVMSRWYCASCLDVMYYLVRRKIKKLINDFEDLDYEVVYGDTDSCFLKFKDLEKLKKDLEKINSSLPEGMFLELEDVFKTAIFVKSRGKNKAAKKKYAMLDYNGELKIKGFEYVRRDWCDLVKNTQKKVLEILLKKQDSKQAISYIRDVILKLQNKKVPKKDLIIRSFIHKNINKYKSKNPAASAYVDAKEKGIELSNNDLIEYIITNKNTKTISSKARVVQFVESGDYDSTYYINNQLIPAISTILEVFGISKDELITQTKQKNLKDYFS